MGKIKLFVDGREIEAEERQTVLEAALSAGIYIPHLCTHPNLPVQAECNLCVVEIEGQEGHVCACETPVQEGLRVRTKSEELKRIRSVSLELMLAGHPKDCTGCKMYLRCELQAVMQYLGTVHARMKEVPRRTNYINTENPLIVREMERCIQCGRCVRACQELRGVGILQYNELEGETYVGTALDLSLVDSDCRFCGACVEVCPTGALQDAQGVFRTDLPKEEALVPCQAECPAHIDIPAYVHAVAEGDCTSAVAIIREKVPFPHALGYVCNNRCEDGCKRGKLNEPVSIRLLKRYAVEHDAQRTWQEQYLRCAPPTGRKVAVIGAGPCGMTAGFYLRKKGHDVTVFEKRKIPGGHMTGGIPEFRLPTEDVMREVELVRQTGVNIVCDCEVKNAAALREEYDAVLIAVGTSYGKKLNTLPGSDYAQVYTAVDLLRASRAREEMNLGETVCIIGGGNVAFDAARTLRRMGKAVNVVCLEPEASQASPEERDQAVEEGVVLLDACESEMIVGTPERVTGLRIHRIEGFSFDPDTHALQTQVIPDSVQTIPCDSIVFAAGQVTGLTEQFGVELNRLGYPVDPATGRSGWLTSVEGVFAAGDAITGTKFIIDAIAGGREAAARMDRYLGGDGEIEEQYVSRKREPRIGKLQGFPKLARESEALRCADERTHDLCPVSTGLTPEQAAREAGRCLLCDLRKDISAVRVWTEYDAP